MSQIKTTRNYRIAELIQIVISDVLKKEVHDPRLSSANVTDVDLSPDSKNATVYFSLLHADEKNILAAEKAFEKANKFFRFQLSRMTELRHTPKLIFQYDRTIDTGERISRLLK
ncbi:MAG: ribosome-binding factor A [Gammaproteobacteria bacterium RIFCSPLOWO2_02_FULL_42_14]|nr:MAG: ribosome-binding factor A [Gammaproteobacteria bacterium RIFCSPHIGHO2_02_FULL_42_43]OGT27289.1 MAG: ribosome-binding factor A [Gammaproteobacteria bacterium RIFCSPHIGHO2_01_FULL_42_8]OGT52963.1 MAG: ribosome-binding factor A [Gammaproteobacteria bacterium RIFCSPHIGHO2_12_FULL_41_25]OGT61263.1 MAG: ribosome-binding factor A [Gammaproteobacteria bacterium RIFCSPLOWO2_02_FULL_42_14]OGT87192.1 MAG: ribosome-binding factor A [Gammaproteobacteria bacterium RIFCSPLOWO2_12_FULL_42_18]